jgi:hypothetical protein
VERGYWGIRVILHTEDTEFAEVFNKSEASFMN